MSVDNMKFWIYDAGALITVLLSFIIGWVRGATKEVFAVVTWIGGVYLTIAAFPHVQEFVREYIKHGLIADFVVACGLLIAFLAILSVVNHMCSNFVRTSMLRMVDNVLGGIFGLVRGCVILAVADIVVSLCFTEMPEMMKEARLQPVASRIANVILLALPDSVQNKLLVRMSQARKQNLLDFIRENVFESIVSSTGQSSQDSNAIVDSKQTNGQTAMDLASLKPKGNSANPVKEQDRPQLGTTNDMRRILDSIS
jgi:membrane protein required for colicin V production